MSTRALVLALGVSGFAVGLWLNTSLKPRSSSGEGKRARAPRPAVRVSASRQGQVFCLCCGGVAYGSSGWSSLSEPHHAVEAPFRSLRASKLARKLAQLVWECSHLYPMEQETARLVRGRRGRLASGMSCTRDRQGPVAPPSLANSTIAPTLLVSVGSTATWGLESTAASRTI